MSSKKPKLVVAPIDELLGDREAFEKLYQELTGLPADPAELDELFPEEKSNG